MNQLSTIEWFWLSWLFGLVTGILVVCVIYIADGKAAKSK